jgi:mannose-1-phosphate guanylyltransferase
MESDMDFLRVNQDRFNACPSESIDYAVMEKTTDAVVVPMDAGWSDIGSWSSLWDISNKDKNNNVSLGDVVLHDSKNCYVRGDNRLVSGIGLDNLVIVDTKDALMVAHKDNVQDAKVIAKQLKENSRSEWALHREVYRPWGKYDSIDNGDNYQVKRLTVNPGAKLSVQMHYHRSEHWVVVAGQARVHYGDEAHDLSVNESTYHGKEVVHALENVGDVPLELIEVQVGSYLGEDDIVRFDDVYGRVKR